MEPMLFTVSRIEGEYAYIKSESDGEELFIALSLLPIGSDIGTQLSFVDGEFSVINQ